MTKSEAAKQNGKKGGRPRKNRESAPKPSAETRHETQHAAETQEPTLTPAEAVAPFANPFGLTTRELLFVEAYCGVAGSNATEAYRIAGFKCKPSSAGPNAGRLIKKDRVARALAARTAMRLQKLIMDGDEALERISRFGRADIRKLFPEGHQIAKLPDDIAFCVKSVTPNRYGLRIELVDPLRANELLAKADGRLKETVKVEHTLEEIMAAANASQSGTAA